MRIEKKFSAIDDYIDGKEVIIAEDKLKNASSRRTLPLIPHIEKLLLEEKQK
ncbi:MAG: site-specific integrase, partial [Ruminococcaceae bacterium]|nr:site-specific integrase [Oscillospiraceae bacterium]